MLNKMHLYYERRLKGDVSTDIEGALRMLNINEIPMSDGVFAKEYDEELLVKVAKICSAIFPAQQSYNMSTSSYGLKHYIERIFGIYVSNYQFKICMQMAGFWAKIYKGLNKSINVYYRIPESSLKYLFYLSYTQTLFDLNKDEN